MDQISDPQHVHILLSHGDYFRHGQSPLGTDNYDAGWPLVGRPVRFTRRAAEQRLASSCSLTREFYRGAKLVPVPLFQEAAHVS